MTYCTSIVIPICMVITKSAHSPPALLATKQSLQVDSYPQSGQEKTGQPSPSKPKRAACCLLRALPYTRDRRCQCIRNLPGMLSTVYQTRSTDGAFPSTCLANQSSVFRTFAASYYCQEQCQRPTQLLQIYVCGLTCSNTDAAPATCALPCRYHWTAWTSPALFQLRHQANACHAMSMQVPHSFCGQTGSLAAHPFIGQPLWVTRAVTSKPLHTCVLNRLDAALTLLQEGANLSSATIASDGLT